FKEKNEEARVHFIPYLKEGVFVTLCAPVVIKTWNISENSFRITSKQTFFFSDSSEELNHS
ncbi:fringe family glycosyltransferase, partial [Methanosarcina mazei]|uniref:fringe family glycosyltransferase n=2 Tax=Methanosarcina mazei TaxID=2209 RepID=UPI001F48BCB6